MNTLTPLAAFEALPVIPSEGSGVIVADRDGLGLATVLLKKGQSDAFAQRVRELFGIELSPGSRRSASRQIAFIATGPGAWLATSDGASNTFATSLAESASARVQSERRCCHRSRTHRHDVVAAR
jgi:hypothetical protein